MTSEIDFYTNPMSRGQIARWALEEVGAPYRQHILGYGDTMKGPDFLAINPMGKVPAIVDDGAVVTECAAICAYLALRFPEAGLLPEVRERAAYFRWLFFAAGPIEQAVTTKAMGWEVSAERERMFGFGDVERPLNVLDAHLATHDYVCGARFTAADIYVGSQVIWGRQFGTIAHRDHLAAYAARLTPRAAYQRAKAIDDALIAEAAAQQN